MTRRPLIVPAAMLLAACLASCTNATDTPSTAPTSTTIEPARTVVVGDSNSTGLAGTLQNGLATGAAWAAHLDTQPPSEVVGGWARDGATSELMAQQVERAPEADVLLLMAGTNDAAVGIDAARRDVALASIVHTVDARRTVVLAVPPIDAAPAQATDLNAELQDFARDEGLDWFDPWSSLRSEQGTWLQEYRLDGIHTTAAGYVAVGEAIGEHLSDPSG